MTKGLSSSMIRVSKNSKPNDPRSQLYPYAYSVPAKDDSGNIVHVHLYTTSSTLLNNFTRQLGNGDKYEEGVFVIDYSFNDYEEEEEEVKETSKRAREKVKA